MWGRKEHGLHVGYVHNQAPYHKATTCTVCYSFPLEGESICLKAL